jgi:tetratricopeptide (TPR) repeat protein
MGAISIFPASVRGRRGRSQSAAGDVQTMLDDGLRYHLAGRIDDAVARYKRALALKPDNADVHNNLGVALAAKGRLDDAVVRYRRAVSLNPDHAAAHGNLGVALAAKGRIADAVTHYERALLLSPGQAGIHYNLGIALAAQGKTDEAAAQYRHAIALKPDYADAHNNLGNWYAAQGKSDDAVLHFRRAIAINPDHAEAHNNLGNIFLEKGEFDGAMAHYDRAIAIKPADTGAHYHRAEIKVFQRGDADLAVLEGLARRRDLPVNKAPFIHLALAKALEDCGDYPRAFEHLRKGNDLKRSQIRYDEPAEVKGFRRTSAVFDRRLFDRFQGQGDPSSVPVFVVGMPRSGSTLIEQILASHPQIHGAGELTDIEIATRTVLNEGCQPLPYPECILGLDGLTLRRIGQRYLARLPALADGNVRIVDKLPGNFLRIGLIRLILPNARIIHTVRDPIDTCVSCYSKLFAAGQHFTYDLAELGRYYRRYRDLMTYWKSVIPPGVMLDVAYEDVVEDLEGQARRLIDYCGLAWDDRCLSFNKTDRPVKTASAVQIRKPLFRSSLERWRKYESGIGPLLKELGDLTAKDLHHVRPADAGKLGDEFAVRPDL